MSEEGQAILKELKRINDKEDKVINGISPTLIANTIYLIDRLQIQVEESEKALVREREFKNKEIDRLQKELEYYKEKERAETDDFDNRDRWE